MGHTTSSGQPFSAGKTGRWGLTMLATLDHVDQEVRVVFAIDITFVTVLVTWLFLLVHRHVFLVVKVSEAVFVGTFESSRSMSQWLVLFSMSECL